MNVTTGNGFRHLAIAAAVLGALVAAPVGGDAAAQEQVIVLSKGGSYQDAQRKAYFEPFTAETGIEVVEASGVDFARIRTMIESGDPQVDVIDTSAHDHAALKRLNLLREIDYESVLTQEEIDAIDPAYLDDHGVPNIVWSMILAYNEEMYPTPPQGWADFWDQEKFPGIRTSAGNRIPPIEQAAFAMGVPPEQIYETPIKDMMEKIKELGENIVFATTPQMVQMLASGEVGMAVTSNGRVEDLQTGGQPIAIQWNGGVLNLVYMVVPNGAPNPENAMKLLEFMSRADRQAELAELILFGPVNQDAYELLDESVRDRLPNAPAHAEQQIVLDSEWWGENRENIDAAWNAIVLGQ